MTKKANVLPLVRHLCLLTFEQSGALFQRVNVALHRRLPFQLMADQVAVKGTQFTIKDINVIFFGNF